MRVSKGAAARAAKPIFYSQKVVVDGKRVTMNRTIPHQMPKCVVKAREHERGKYPLGLRTGS